jgi:hypothetical protein
MRDAITYIRPEALQDRNPPKNHHENLSYSTNGGWQNITTEHTGTG